MSSSHLDIKQLVLIPALITLCITILRLAGELNAWSPMLFGREAGGGFSIIGISWLPIILGPYFAVKLVKRGHPPTSVGKVIGFSILALALSIGIPAGTTMVTQAFPAMLVAYIIGAIVAVYLVSKTWPAFFKILIAYAYAARIPVAILMLFAIFGQWGTHYDAPVPNQPEMGPFATWLTIGLLPQTTSWIAYTAIVGGFFGGIAAAAAKKPAPKQV